MNKILLKIVIFHQKYAIISISLSAIAAKLPVMAYA